MHQESTKNLGFLLKFMKETGITNADVAKALGCNRSFMSYNFKRDDMPLSKVYRIMDCFGYGIQFRFAKRETDFRESSEGVELTMKTRPYIEVMPRFAGKRLAYLRSYMEYNGITYKFLAEALDVRYATIMAWLRNDDCFVSYLYQAAAALGAKLEIGITPKPQTPEE